MIKDDSGGHLLLKKKKAVLMQPWGLKREATKWCRSIPAILSMSSSYDIALLVNDTAQIG